MTRQPLTHRWATAVLAAMVCLWITAPLHAQAIRAQVWEVESKRTPLTGLASLLKQAGFTVTPLDTDRAPSSEEVDLIAIGSFANESDTYSAYMKKHAAALQAFVADGGVLLQLAQREESQLVPAFMPAELRAIRGDAVLGDLRVVRAEHPLLAGVRVNSDGLNRLELPAHLGSEASWHTFMDYAGCAVLIGSGEGADNPALLEAAHGRGRFVLASIAFDRLDDAAGKRKAPEPYANFAEAFTRNLARYVANVSAGTAPPVEPTPAPTPWSFVPGSWTIAVLPDTQYYSRNYPEVFETQTRWVAEHTDELNIRYVLHLGDITNNNVPEQWDVAQRAMSHLDGEVPYAIVGGNHDYGPNGDSTTRDSLINEYFPLSRFAEWPTFGGAMEEGKVDNTYHLFEVAGEQWLVLALEWAPRDAVVEWADRVLQEHADRQVIVITHAYLFADGTRYDWNKYGRQQSATPHHYENTKLPGRGNDGEELWQKLVGRHSNVVLTLNGHVLRDGVAQLSSEGTHGNTVHQMLVNYQRTRPQNGNGFLRLYEFLPDGKTIQARSYSPVLDVYKTDVQNQFRLQRDR